MGTGRLRSASLILLSLCLAGRSSSLTGWVFTEPWLHASAGDSVLLRCLFQDPEATGWTVTKVDWLRVPVAGKQKVGQNRGVGNGRESQAAPLLLELCMRIAVCPVLWRSALCSVAFQGCTCRREQAGLCAWCWLCGWGERLQCSACWAPLTSRSVPGQEEMVFYYYSNSSVPVGRFQDRVRWQGDVSCWDGSIQLQDVQVNDSGTYTCEIRLFQHGSIFKNHTMLRVSPATQRGVCPSSSPHLSPHPTPRKGVSIPTSTALQQCWCPCGLQPLPWCLPADRGAESAQVQGRTGVWAVTVCCSAVAVVLAFLAGLNLRKRYQRSLRVY